MRLVTLLFSLILSTTPAMAAPLQVVSVNEEIYGISGSHIYVLRTLTDNLGHHRQEQTDVVLIKRRKGTNWDEKVFPIERKLDHGPDHIETIVSPRLVYLPLDYKYHPSATLYFDHAYPTAAQRPEHLSLTKANGIDFTHDTQGVTVTVRTPRTAYQTEEDILTKSTYTFDNATLSRLIAGSLDKTRDTLRPYYVEDADVLKNIEFNPEQDCQFINLTERFMQTDGEQQGFWVARITCENETATGPISMLLTLQPAP